MSGPNSPELVQAYKDITGRLHSTHEDAVLANKAFLRSQAYGELERIFNLNHPDTRTYVINKVFANKDQINRWVDQYKENER